MPAVVRAVAIVGAADGVIFRQMRAGNLNLVASLLLLRSDLRYALLAWRRRECGAAVRCWLAASVHNGGHQRRNSIRLLGLVVLGIRV